MPLTQQEKRFVALCRALEGAGLMGAEPAPLVSIDYAPPAGAVPRWRAGADTVAAQAVIDGWDWTPRTAGQDLSEEAVRGLLSDPDPRIRGLVNLLRVAFVLINDGREARGENRLQEPDVIALGVASLMAET